MPKERAQYMGTFKFFGREPALWLSLISAAVMVFSAMLFQLTPDQQGVINAVALAFFGLLTAWSVERDGLSAALLGFIKAIIALAVAFGLQLPAEKQALLMTLVSAVVAMFLRTQLSPPAPPISAAPSGTSKS